MLFDLFVQREYGIEVDLPVHYLLFTKPRHEL